MGIFDSWASSFSSANIGMRIEASAGSELVLTSASNVEVTNSVLGRDCGTLMLGSYRYIICSVDTYQRLVRYFEGVLK